MSELQLTLQDWEKLYNMLRQSEQLVQEQQEEIRQLAIRTAKLETLNHSNGKTRKCNVCGGTEFTTRDVLMSTSGATFFGLDWMNPSATAYVCEQCGYIMLYTQVSPKQDEKRDDPDMLEAKRKRSIEWFENRT